MGIKKCLWVLTTFRRHCCCVCLSNDGRKSSSLLVTQYISPIPSLSRFSLIANPAEKSIQLPQLGVGHHDSNMDLGQELEKKSVLYREVSERYLASQTFAQSNVSGNAHLWIAWRSLETLDYIGSTKEHSHKNRKTESTSWEYQTEMQ